MGPIMMFLAAERKHGLSSERVSGPAISLIKWAGRWQSSRKHTRHQPSASRRPESAPINESGGKRAGVM